MQDNVIHGVMDTGAPAVDRSSPVAARGHVLARNSRTPTAGPLTYIIFRFFSLSSFAYSFPSSFLSFTFSPPRPFAYPFLPSAFSYLHFHSLSILRLFLPSLLHSLLQFLSPSFLRLFLPFLPSFFTSISLFPSFLRLSHHSLPRSFLHFLSPSFLPHLLSVLRPSLFTLSFSNGPSLFSHFIIASHSSAMDWYYLSISSTFCQWKGFPSIALRVIFSLTLILLSILILLSFISIFRPPLPFFPRVLLITSSHSLFCLLCCSLSLPLYRGAATVPLRIIKTYLPASKPKTLSEIFAFFF